MIRYLVTGGAGFIGANLVRRLVENGKRVFLIIEENTDLWRLQDILSKITIVKISLTDLDRIHNFVRDIKPDIIFHLAAFGGLPNQKSPKKIFDVNFYGTVNLLNACRKIGFDCFINTGSSSEYGIKDSAFKENDILEPVSDYGVSKAASTQYCLKEALFNKLPVYTIRPFSVYGDFEMAGRLISSIFINLLKNQSINLSSPECVRDFIYIQDVVDFYIKLSEKRPQKDFIFNVGTGKQFSIKQVVKTVEQILNKKVDVCWGKSEARPWEPKVWKASIQRAEKNLNWQPKFCLNDGLKNTFKWFQKNITLYDLMIENDKTKEFKTKIKSA